MLFFILSIKIEAKGTIKFRFCTYFCTKFYQPVATDEELLKRRFPDR